MPVAERVSSVRRRRVIASLSLAIGIGGCVGGPGETAADSGSPTDSRAGTDGTTVADGSTSTAAPADRLPIDAVALRSAYRYVFSVDAVGVAAPDRDQFAFVRPPDEAAGPPPESFSLELGDRSFAPEASLPGADPRAPSSGPSTPGVEEVYAEANRSGALAFDLPTVAAPSGALVVDGGRFPLPDEVLPRFERAPTFERRSVAVPETVAPGDAVVLSVEVANVGDRTGTYLAGFRTAGQPTPVDVRLEPGATGRESVEYRAAGEAGTATEFVFSHPGGRETFEVAVEGDG